MNKKILITGVNGFIGSKIASLLVNKYSAIIKVIGFDLGPDTNIPGIEYYQYNLDDGIPEELDFNYIIHLAGQPSVFISEKNPIEDFYSNVANSLNIVSVAIKKKTPLVFLSTIAVYSNSELPHLENEILIPEHWYGMNKLTVERYLEFSYKKYKLPYVAFRLSYLYDADVKRGPIADIKCKGNLYRFNNPESVFDFIHVFDLFSAIEKVLEYNFKFPGVYNLGFGKGVKIKDIGDFCGEDKDYSINSNPKKVLLVDIEKFSKLYNWKPSINLFDFLKETYIS